MFLAVWMLCFVLGALAYLEPRSRVLLALLALVAIQTAYADLMDVNRLTQIFLKLPIDFAAGMMSLFAVDLRRRNTVVVSGLFALTFLLHATFWSARAMGVDLWLWYAYSLNIVFLAQLMAIALPGGKRLVGELASWGRMVGDFVRRLSDLGNQPDSGTAGNQAPHGAGCAAIFRAASYRQTNPDECFSPEVRVR